MKKLLGIVVLGLLLSGNVVFGDRPDDLEILDFKEYNAISNITTSASRERARATCESKRKFVYQFESSANARDGKRWRQLRFYCTREKLSHNEHPIYGDVGWTQAWGVFGERSHLYNKIILTSYSQKKKEKWDSEDNKTAESKTFSGDTKDAIKKQCLEFGFKEGTELFADCQLKLFMLQNQNSNNTQDTNQNPTIIIQSDNSGNKRKIDPSVWDDLLKLGGISSGSSSSSSSGSTSMPKGTCYNTGEETGGTNKSCKYSCSGNIVTTTISALQVCPLHIQR